MRVGRFACCELCGAIGHTQQGCALRRLQEMQDPHGTRRRPLREANAVDPAVRDATAATLFLPGAALSG